MIEHTPDTEEVACYYEGPDLDAGDRRAAFDRWLAETIRQAKAEAWGEGRDEALAAWKVNYYDPHQWIDPNPYAEEADHE